ncbi:MAG TPA: glycosyltransferase family 2 protein [Chroococcales cyanobacterium]
MSLPDSVSFLVVNCNGRPHLAALLDSISRLNDLPERSEIWVVDNASTDGSREWLLAEWPDVRLIENSTNEGFARPNNVAARMAGGEWLCLVNNDMVLHPDWLKELFEGKGAAACAGSTILDWDGARIDFDGGAVAFTGQGLQPRWGEKNVCRKNVCRKTPFACGGAMLVRRESFLEAGGFDERYFAYFEDVDLGWRLWLQGHEVVQVPGAIAYHRHGATSRKAFAFQKKVLLERNALFTLVKNYEDENMYRILAASLLLANKRFALNSGIDRTEFEFSLSSRPFAKPSVPWERIFEVLKKRGFTFLFRKAVLALAEKVVARLGRLPYAEGGVLIDRAAYAQIVAMEEVLENLPSLMEERASIQEKRKRSDAEIFAIFGDPFHVLDASLEYRMAHEKLVRAWGIGEIFEVSR